MKLFHICTIANDLEQYERMKESFLNNGFDENKCCYSLFDNSQSNVHEPYTTFNYIQATTSAKYIIFCHQDVILNQGHGYEHLKKSLEALEKLDSRWAVAGNAGINSHFKIIAKITDPSTPIWNGVFPQKVFSLDENFLITKTCESLRCSNDLAGFHCYGSDLCLNAIQKGYSCYVIDFHLTHLSSGSYNQLLYDSQEKFYRRWNREFIFSYIRTTCSDVVLLSKYQVLRRFGNRNKIKKVLLNSYFMHSIITPYWQPFQSLKRYVKAREQL